MTMSQQIAREAYLLLYSFILGAFLTFVYDLLRISRRLLPRGKWLVASEDILYWATAALSFFLLLHLENDGSLRGFALFGLALGVILYGKVLSPYVVRALVFLFGKIFHILFWPVAKIFKIFKKLLQWMGKSARVTMYHCVYQFRGKWKHGSEKSDLSKD